MGSVMKRLASVVLLALAVASGFALPQAEAHGWRRGASVVIGLGDPFFYGPFYDPWLYGRPFYPPPFYYPPPVTTVIVRETRPAFPRLGETTGAPGPQFWYYCEAERGYYPYVAQCPQGWLEVPVAEVPPPSALEEKQ